ncbi:MAG: ATP cone domain-containing protein [Planctomycetota bacterium]|nr:ATP cone domain-containing protein [Planctomycetota bacterium]
MTPLRQVRKRDGRLVPFDRGKIAEAIFRAAQSVGGEDRFLAEELAGVVVARLHGLLADRAAGEVPTIEDVQDLVERVLIDAGHARTAKAYILYRERRAEARAARADAGEDAALESRPPLVGGDTVLDAQGRAQADIRRFSKADVAERLVRREGLERVEAEAIARAVEDRVLRAHAPRLSAELLDTLVHAELFERGWTVRATRARRGGLHGSDVQAALEHGLGDRRALDPSALVEGLGESLVAQHVLDHQLPPPVAEAHRTGDLHVYDLGAPLRLSSIALSAPEVAPGRMHGERFSREGGVQRAFAVLEELLLSYAPHAARVLAVEDVNVWLAPFVAHLDEDALAEAVRQFLLSPVLGAVHRRGGLLRLELGLGAEIPPRLAFLDTPEPAPPGRRFGDYGETALHVTRAFLHEAAELRRVGHWVDCALTLCLPRGGARDASRRALVRQALAAAGEGGEPVILFDDAAAPTRGSRWFRLRESEAPDPLRFDRGDVSAAGAVAVNLVAAALRTRRAGLEDFIREVDRLVRLALDAAVSQRSLLDGLGENPGGALYALRRGTHPLVDLEAAFHLVEVVGADQAVALLLPGSESVERLGMRGRVLKHVHGRVREEALARRLQAAVCECLAPEAATRFARCDAERYPRAADWWPVGDVPTYAQLPAEGTGLSREPLHPDRLKGGPSLLRVRHRVGGDRHPPMEDLLRAMEAAERDTAVLEYAVDPWPRRVIHEEPDSR